MERTIKHKLKRTHNREKIRKQGSDYCRISCERCVLSCSLKACRPTPSGPMGPGFNWDLICVASGFASAWQQHDKSEIRTNENYFHV